jgi:hypothetical protein
MKHLEDEDIGRMIEGTISKGEREDFLNHLAKCSTCFEVYTDTLKFVEKERKRPTILKLPIIEKIGIAVHSLWQYISTRFRNKRPVLVPAFAVLVIVLLIGPFVLKELHDRRIAKAQIQQIVMDIENMGSQAFSPSKDEIYSAVRAGIFVEDLTLVVNAGGHEELKTKISKMLSDELKTIYKNVSDPIFQELEHIERKNLKTVVQNIQERVGKRSFPGLFRFGRFIEYSFLSTFENKMPNQEDIEKHQRIVQKYKDNLPPGIFKELKKLKTTTGVEESKKIFLAIKEITLSLD